MHEIAQLCLIKKVKFSSLVIMNINYWLFKLYISINKKDRLETGLIIKGVSKDIWFISIIENVLFILANKVFINLIINIILKNKFKAKIVFFFIMALFYLYIISG